MQTIRVSTDGFADLDFTFDAYTNGEHWNGWEAPYFTRFEADRIVQAFNCAEYVAHHGNVRYAYYDAKWDIYVFPDNANGEYDEQFAGVWTEHGILYPLGAWSWCWDEVE